MAFILKALGGIMALALLLATLFGSILTLGGFLIAVIKLLVLMIFIAVLALMVFFIVRDRTQRRRESHDF